MADRSNTTPPKVPASFRTSTGCVHAARHGRTGGPIVDPIVQTTTYIQPKLGEPIEHAYSRVSNPTVSALELAIGELEDAPPAIAYASGIAAEAGLFLALLRAGDHVICGEAVYGGTVRLLDRLLRDLGVDVDFVDTTDTQAVRRHITPRTKLVFIETPANPTLVLSDIRKIAEITHAAGALLAVDNTFQTPILQRPLELGADISVYSTTKFHDGHSAAVGGAVVSRDQELLERIRFVRKCTGAIQKPFDAWITLQGIRTLDLRIRQQSANASKIARWLADHPAVERVHYPGLDCFAQQELASSQHIDGVHGAVLSFELAGGVPAGKTFVSSVKLAKLVEHVGSLETLVTHSASMTHADVPPAQRERVGITDGLVRVSVGLESPDDVIADFEQSIEAAVRNYSGVLVGTHGVLGKEGACPATL